MNQPKVSIIIPSYNVEHYINDCLDSLVTQSYKNIEIICIDDGSTDGTLSILNTYKTLDDRILVLSQHNQGQSVARNEGLKHVTGEYVCFLDADDMLTHDAIKILVTASVDNIEIVTFEMAPLLYENDDIQKNSNKDYYYYVKNEYLGIDTGAHFLKAKIQNNDFVDSAGLLFIKTDWLKKENIVFSPGMYYEDSIFVLECYIKCNRMKHISEQLYIYRIHYSSTMNCKLTEKHLLSRTWQFIECLKLIIGSIEDDETVNALCSYSHMVIGALNNTINSLSEKDLKKTDDFLPLHKLIINNMCNRTTAYNGTVNLKLLGLVSAVDQANAVILYGAGTVGNITKEFLKRNGFENKILGFATSTANKEIEVDGTVVKNIKNYQDNTNALVIVSARESYHKEMIGILQETHFHKYCCIDYELEAEIEKEIYNKNI